MRALKELDLDIVGRLELLRESRSERNGDVGGKVEQERRSAYPTKARDERQQRDLR